MNIKKLFNISKQKYIYLYTLDKIENLLVKLFLWRKNYLNFIYCTPSSVRSYRIGLSWATKRYNRNYE